MLEGKKGWGGSEQKGLEAKQTLEGVKMVLSETDLEQNRPFRFLVFWAGEGVKQTSVKLTRSEIDSEQKILDIKWT